MLVTADWVLPIGRPPIRDGAVLIRNGTIAAVDTAKKLTVNYSGPRHEYPGCVLLPGLVNAHTHLAFTCLKGVIPSMPFAEWIRYIPIAFRSLSADDIVASIAHGAIKAIVSGTTVVADIAYGPESVAVAADSGLGGTFYWEVLGITPSELAETLYEREFPTDPIRVCSIRLRCGISPHAPYTSGPELIRAAHLIATAQHAGFAIHAAESDAETQLLTDGTGPLAQLAGRLAHGFTPPGSSTIAYLDRLEALNNAVIIHGAKVLPSDVPALARRAKGVVLCPRSNEYLENGKAPAWRFERAGVPLALGTDSLASNQDLDLFEEARALHAIEPRFDAHRLIEMITLGGARVLDMADEFGELAPGKQADLAIYRVPPTEDPYTALFDVGGRGSIEAVLSAGIWRVLSGAPIFGVSVIERASHLAAQKASLAVALDSPGL